MIRNKWHQLVVVFVIVLWDVQAISNLEPNVKNTITEEERRGAPTLNSKEKDNLNANSQKKIIVDELNGDKKTRGIHSPSASHKHHHYFVPSGYDSHLAATGHGGSAYSAGPTSGYEYGSHGSGPSGGGGGLTGGSSHGHHGPSHHGPTGYAASATGYGGYGSSPHGYGSPGGYGGLHGLGGHAGGHGGAGGHSLYGQGGGLHNALALKGLLIPLAGIALLGAAAALSTNPVLLQLGVVNGKRRRRSIDNNREVKKTVYPRNPYVRPELD